MGGPSLGSSKPETIKEHFRKRGVLDESFAVSSRPCEENDPFEDGDEIDTSETHNLIGHLGPAEASYSVSEHVQGDDNLPGFLKSLSLRQSMCVCPPPRP